MGPNGSGKSTLAHVLAGRAGYEVTGGRGPLRGQGPARAWRPRSARREGVFLAFQYPVEIPGVSNAYFLQGRAQRRSASTAARRSSTPWTSSTLVQREDRSSSTWTRRCSSRPVNEGFSGGEKKRNEILQMAVLEPAPGHPRRDRLRASTSTRCAIVADGVNALRSPDRAIIVVTHYQRLLNYIVPDFVHVLVDGRIVQSGGKELALELEEKGYDWLEVEPAEAAPAGR